jgi:hypothetical protein
MLSYRRVFMSASLIALLLFTTLFPSKADRAYACPVEAPYTLLQLYLDSDLAVVADITSEEIVKRDDDPGEEVSTEASWIELRKHIRVVDIYKGLPPKNLSFIRTEYFPRVKNENLSLNEEETRYSIIPGNRYLLFFEKNEETGSFDLVSSSSAVIELDTARQALYDRRIDELSAIVKARKNQLPKLTEWLVKLAEDPITLYDGATDIARSFYRLNEPDDEPDESEESREMRIFSLEEYGRAIYNPDVAKSLTESQKRRLSNVLEGQLQDSLSDAASADGPSIDYELVRLVRNWDRDDLTMRANGMIQASDPNDSKRIGILMMLITFAVDDEKLGSTYYEYRNLTENEEEETAAMVEEIAETPLPSTEANPESQAVNETKAEADEPETATPVLEQRQETAGQADDVETPSVLRARLVRQFTDRFQYLLAKGFPDETEIFQPDELHTDEVKTTTP